MVDVVELADPPEDVVVAVDFAVVAVEDFAVVAVDGRAVVVSVVDALSAAT